MKSTMQMAVSVVVAALGLGCNWINGDSGHNPMDEGMSSIAYAGTRAQEGAQEMEDYAYTKKSQFVTKAKKELADIQSELNRLSAQIDRSTGAAKAEARQKLKLAQEKWAQAKMQLDRAENATESSWDDVVHGFHKQNAELKEAFEDTRRWLSEKIGP